jgi:transposase-like protein
LKKQRKGSSSFSKSIAINFKGERRMTQEQNDTLLQSVMEELNSKGFEGFAEAVRILLNEAMRLEREKALQAGYYERTESRKGHANGYKLKTVKTRLGKLTVDIPQVRGDVEFYPSALEKGIRSERALKLAIAEMYVKGVSTRKVTRVLEKMCGLTITASQVSRASKELDDELAQWRSRPLGEYAYLILDARYEKVRQGGSLISSAVMTAVGVNEDGRRSVLGCGCSMSEAEVHWKNFLSSIRDRGLSGVRYVVSDDHTGLRAALEEVFSGVTLQRCQCHLQRNAFAYIPRVKWCAEVAADIRDIWNAPDREEAEVRLKKYVLKWRDKAPRLADWMEENLQEGLAVFALPEKHRRRLRTTNMLEVVNREIKRRPRVARLFPNEESLIRLVSAILMEISEDWETGRVYLEMIPENEHSNTDSSQIYRKNVA